MHLVSRVALFLLSALLTGLAHPTAAESAAGPVDADRALDALMEETFERYLELDPTFAASIGDRRAADRLTVGLDPEYRRSLRGLYEESLERLDGIELERLSPERRLYADAFREAQSTRLRLMDFPEELLPLRPGWGFTTRFAKISSGVDDLKFDSIEDHQAFLTRVDDLERWVDLAIEGMRRGLEEGVVHPRSVVARTIVELDGQLDPERAVEIFGLPLRTLPEDLDAEDRQVWARHLKMAIEDGVVPSYTRLRSFLIETYLPRSRESISLSELPNGREWYRALVRAFTTTELTPEEIFELGEQEARRIRRRIDVLERRTPGSRVDASNRWKHVHGRFVELEASVRERLPELFHRVPETPLDVRRVEAFREGSTAGAFYERPAPDGSRPGVFYVNMARGGFNLSNAEALFLHEALPGHHFQIADAQEREHLPRFLRFGYVGAYVEGWGLYAESLGRDLGLYRSPQQLLGRLYFELGRAGRLVADVGIHHLGWSREEAVRELGKRRLDWAVGEIDRYVNLPGQALTYKVGETRIQELRRRAEEDLGDAFDPRDFHEQILSTGPLPLSVLERKVELWLARP